MSSRVERSWPTEAHIRTVRSSEPDAMHAPSGENATARTNPVRPLRIRRRRPDSDDLISTSSLLVAAICSPFGEKAKLSTIPVWTDQCRGDHAESTPLIT